MYGIPYIAIILPAHYVERHAYRSYYTCKRRRRVLSSETMRKKRVKTTFWLLERAEGEEAILSKAPKIDIRVPSGVVLPVQDVSTVDKYDSTRAGMVCGPRCSCIRRRHVACHEGWKWSHTLQDVADAPLSINQRRQGGDFALLKIERGRLKNV